MKFIKPVKVLLIVQIILSVLLLEGCTQAQQNTSQAGKFVSEATKAAEKNSSEGVTVMKDNDYEFSKSMSKEVLNNYLSRFVTATGFIVGSAYGNIPAGLNNTFKEDFEMIKRIGAKYIGRSAFIWASVPDIDKYFSDLASHAKIIHDYDSQIILEACIFEIITREMTDQVTIPDWVFKEFSLPVEQRTFNFEEMVFDKHDDSNGLHSKNYWGDEQAVPDITKIETQMWFYYLGCRYIDSGIEAIHMGQMMLIGGNDSGNAATTSVFKRIRGYAAQKARHNLVLLNAHIYQGAGVYSSEGDSKLLFDFHMFPIRPMDTGNEKQTDGFQPITMKNGFIDSIYGKSSGGINPNGWKTDSNPYIVEFDNSGYDADDRDYPKGSFHPWGYDEITWFARQPEKRRAEVLEYINDWITSNEPDAHLSMPVRIPLAYAFNITYTMPDNSGDFHVSDVWYFRANKQTVETMDSFNLEDVIIKLWLKK